MDSGQSNFSPLERGNPLLVALERTTNEMEARVVKAIATLSLIGGPLWPTEGAIGASLGLEIGTTGWKLLSHALAALVERKTLVHRRYADEYHLWRGTDFDLSQELEHARSNVTTEFDLAGFLNKHVSLPPHVARRTSFETGTVRLFAREFIGVDELLDGAGAQPRFASLEPTPDGLVLYVLPSTKEELARVRASPPLETLRPILLVLPQAPLDVNDVALDLHALSLIESQDAVQSDAVAKTEVLIRRRALQELVDARLHELTRPNGQSIWRDSRRWRRLASQRQLQSLLSDACDRTYTLSPKIRNELINRHRLSTSVVVAVKKILTSLLDGSDKPGLGFEGNGPEVSIFRAVFERTGAYAQQGRRFSLRRPGQKWRLSPAWTTINKYLSTRAGTRRRLDVLFNELRNPPFGIRDGLIPVLVWGVLIAGRDRYCLFERGTYIPEWSAEIYDRMLRAPGDFQVSALPRGTVRQKLISQLTQALPSRVITEPIGVNTLLRSMFSWYRSLPEFSRHTGRVSGGAQEFRRVVASASDPIEMLFITLPRALETGGGRPATSPQYPEAFRRVIRELDHTYSALLLDLLDVLSTRFAFPISLGAARSKLAAMAAEFEGEPCSQEVTAFLMRARSTESTDEAWLESVAAGIVGQPSKFWIDDNVEEFRLRVARVAHELVGLRQARLLRDNPPTQRRLSVMAPSGVIVDDVFEVNEVSPKTSRTQTRIARELEKLTEDERKTVLLELVASTWRRRK